MSASANFSNSTVERLGVEPVARLHPTAQTGEAVTGPAWGAQVAVQLPASMSAAVPAPVSVQVPSAAVSALVPAQTPPTSQPAPPAAAQLAAFRAIALVLAVRLLLLLALMGGFSLAVMSMLWQTPVGVAIVVAYAVLLMLPLVWLETKKAA
jgi:hypothetical protein